jgi:hypothetical protein
MRLCCQPYFEAAGADTAGKSAVRRVQAAIKGYPRDVVQAAIVGFPARLRLHCWAIGHLQRCVIVCWQAVRLDAPCPKLLTASCRYSTSPQQEAWTALTSLTPLPTGWGVGGAWWPSGCRCCCASCTLTMARPEISWELAHDSSHLMACSVEQAMLRPWNEGSNRQRSAQARQRRRS